MGITKVKQKLYIIHGWTYSLDRWTKVCKVLESRGFEIIQLRVPGLNEPSDKVWDIEGYVKWLDDSLKGESKPIVIGHSNGGRIAMAYIQRHPGRLKQLILVDAAGIPLTGATKLAKRKLVSTLSPVARAVARNPVLKRGLYKAIGAHDYLNAPPNMKLTMRNMLDTDKTINLAEINLPVTIIWGRNDLVTPLSDGKRLNAGIKDSTLHIINNSRHAPYFDHPEEVADIIGDVTR
jgi:2-hydroxy-6-oxonona-2,4-dienedioate hydrolase